MEQDLSKPKFENAKRRKNIKFIYSCSVLWVNLVSYNFDSILI